MCSGAEFQGELVEATGGSKIIASTAFKGKITVNNIKYTPSKKRVLRYWVCFVYLLYLIIHFGKPHLSYLSTSPSHRVSRVSWQNLRWHPLHSIRCPRAPVAAPLNRQLVLWDFALAELSLTWSAGHPLISLELSGVSWEPRWASGDRMISVKDNRFRPVSSTSCDEVGSFQSFHTQSPHKNWRVANHNISHGIKPEKLQLSKLEAAWNNSLKTASWGPPHLMSHCTHA